LIKFLYEKTEEAFYIIFDSSTKLLSDYLAKFRYFRKKTVFSMYACNAYEIEEINHVKIG